MLGTLRYHRVVEGSDSDQEIDASYGLRSAMRAMASDFVYTRHSWHLRYNVKHGKHSVSEMAWGGVILGRAPLDERFVLGNSVALRGWNKYDIDPIGGNRVIANSVEYRYGHLQAFYDAGAVWDEGETATLRHSVGIGVRESIFSLALAFPIRAGRVEPVLIMDLLY